MEVLHNASLAALASMFVGLLPLAAGVIYAIWPSEHRLLLVRPLTIATVFGALGGSILGFLNELVYLSQLEEIGFTRQVAVSLAESFVPMFTGFGCLTVAWLCVTIGLWRRP